MVATRSESADQTYGKLMALLESQGLAWSRDPTLVLNNWSGVWYRVQDSGGRQVWATGDR